MKLPSVSPLFYAAMVVMTVVGAAHAAEDTASGKSVTVATPSDALFPGDVSTCILCHTTPELFKDEKQKFFISKEFLAADGHLKKGVRCHDCHGGNPTAFEAEGAHATEVKKNDLGITPFRLPLTKVQQACFDCHKDHSAELTHGVHAEAGKDEEGNKRPLLCSECHGKKTHGILAVDDPDSPVFADKQVQLCGNCHKEQLKEYDKSVHGHGLHRAGLLVVAVCADCHHAHAIYPADDERSTLYTTHVAGTCSKCHRFIEERLRHSVHGGGNGLGGKTEKPAPGGKIKRHPSCIDCHEGHDLPHPNSDAFRLRSADRCGNCHVDLLHSYSISMHGQLTHLGFVPGAKCSDCHGAHDILPLDDPNCRLAPGENRHATCEVCHPNVVPNFLDFDPHADHRNPDRSFLLYAVYMVLLTLLIGTFGFFGLHSLFWFFRNLVEVLKHGRPKPLTPGDTAFIRFSSFHRVGHTIMLVSFLGLASTGLPLKYSQHEWARMLAHLLGGFESTGLWHRIFGLINIGCLIVYVVLMLTRLVASRKSGGSWLHRIFSPDSPVPNFRDLKDFLKMVRWFVGRGPKPTFERWAYWEKVDMWGASADIVIIGFTGLILWFPSFFCSFLPGQTLNIAKVIHSTQALLATGFVFSIHFFSTHLRPDKFPLDMSILTGLVSEEELEEERPEYLDRLRREGRLDEMKAIVPPRRRLLLVGFGGIVAFSIGFALLIGILTALVSG